MMDNNEIIHRYTYLVKIIAAKYCRYGVAFDDLLQEGLIGLLEAEKRFDPRKEVKFSTYASHWIKKKMLEALNRERKVSLNAVHLEIEEMDSLVEIPAEVAVQTLPSLQLPKDFPEREAKILRFVFEEHKTLREIADILGIAREKVRQLQQLAFRRIRLNPKLTQALSGFNDIAVNTSGKGTHDSRAIDQFEP